MTTTPPPSPPVPGGNQDVDFDELARKLVSTLRLREPKVHRALLMVCAFLAVVCLLATITRASAAPLIPLAGVVLAGLFTWRVRSAPSDRKLVGQLSLFAVTVSVALWAMSYIARTMLFGV